MHLYLHFLFACLIFDYASCVISETEMKEYYRSLPKVNFSLADAVKTDVIYKYFRDASVTEGKILTEGTVRAEQLDTTVPTVVIIHGYTTDDTSPWYAPLKNEYFKLGPHNIIYLNWSKAGNKSYAVSSANIKPVGKYVAEFLIASKVPQHKIHLIGHSLGSQLTAFIGKSMFQLSGKKIGRITGLDPAGPQFDYPPINSSERLCPDDAEFVDVIHTDVQLFGYASPTGHVDFYPNGGGHQIGCPPWDQDDNCSHARSTLYFIESLSTKTRAMEATYTEENYNITVKVKEDPRKVIFGQHIDYSSRGVYIFTTNSQKPFLRTLDSKDTFDLQL